MLGKKSCSYEDSAILFILSAEHTFIIQLARIHTSSLIKIEKILNRPITKFDNSNDVNVIAADVRLIKRRPTSFYKRHNLI